jgi:hypothetical protein
VRPQPRSRRKLLGVELRGDRRLRVTAGRHGQGFPQRSEARALSRAEARDVAGGFGIDRMTADEEMRVAGILASGVLVHVRLLRTENRRPCRTFRQPAGRITVNRLPSPSRLSILSRPR